MNPIKKFKKDLAFERKHKEYFIILYIRIIILLFLLAVSIYYYTNIKVCNSWNGTLKNKNSLYRLECVPESNFNEETLFFDYVYKENLINSTKT